MGLLIHNPVLLLTLIPAGAVGLAGRALCPARLRGLFEATMFVATVAVDGLVVHVLI